MIFRFDVGTPLCDEQILELFIAFSATHEIDAVWVVQRRIDAVPPKSCSFGE